MFEYITLLLLEIRIDCLTPALSSYLDLKECGRLIYMVRHSYQVWLLHYSENIFWNAKLVWMSECKVPEMTPSLKESQTLII